MCIKHSVRTWGHTQPDKDYRWVPSPPPATPGAQAGPVSQAGTLLTKNEAGQEAQRGLWTGPASPHTTVRNRVQTQNPLQASRAPGEPEPWVFGARGDRKFRIEPIRTPNSD